MVRQRNKSEQGLSATEVRDEDVDVTFMVWLTSRATTDLLDAALAPAGLDSDEFAIYSVLNAAPVDHPDRAGALDGRSPDHRVELRQAVRGSRAREARAEPGRPALLPDQADPRRTPGVP